MELEEIVRVSYPVADEDVRRLVACARLVHLKKGQFVITQGKKNENLYFIRNGMLRSFCEYDGKEDTRWFAIEGDVIASLHSLYKGLPAMSSIEALVPTDVYCVSRLDIEALIADSGDLVYWAYNLAMEQLFALEMRYTFVGVGDAYSRYKSFIKMRPSGMVQQIPLKHIASYLKITPQTLSKIRLKYARE